MPQKGRTPPADRYAIPGAEQQKVIEERRLVYCDVDYDMFAVFLTQGQGFLPAKGLPEGAQTAFVQLNQVQRVARVYFWHEKFPSIPEDAAIPELIPEIVGIEVDLGVHLAAGQEVKSA